MPTRSREIWSLDLFSGFGTTPSGHKFMAVFVDNFSLFSLAVPIIDKTTTSIITALKDHIIMHFGPPRILRTDGETAILKSEVFQTFLKNFNIIHAPTAPSSPWSNGLAERMVAKYKENIRTYAKSHQDLDISEFVAIISNSFNQTPTTYGPTPSELMYGYSNTNLHDVIPAKQVVKNHNAYLKLIQSNIDRAHKILETRREKNKEATLSSRNASRSPRVFLKDQVVNLRNTVIAKDSALVAKQRGPYLIESVNDNNKTCQVKEIKTGKVRKAHFDICSVATTGTR
ncbi:MAG: transposase family protein [Pseudomonadota bacterium]